MRAKYIALDRRRQLCRRQTHNLQSADDIVKWDYLQMEVIMEEPLDGEDMILKIVLLFLHTQN